MKIEKITRALSLLLFAPSIIFASPSFATMTTDFDAIVNSYVASGSFSGQVYATDNAGFTYNKSFNVPTGGIMFSKSATKPVTAAAVMTLVDASLVNLSDPINTYVTYPMPAGGSVTVRDLLAHTSGIPDYIGSAWFQANRATNQLIDDVIDQFKNDPLNFTPGTQFEYSSANYVVLAKLIENVTGMSYGAYVNSVILTPSAMADTGVLSLSSLPTNWIFGNILDGAGNWILAPQVDGSTIIGAGALYSTASDLNSFVQSLNAGLLVTPGSYLDMTTPGLGNYGLGMFIETNAFVSKTEYHHPASFYGYSGVISHIPVDDLTIVILSDKSHTVSNIVPTHLKDHLVFEYFF